VFRTERDFFGRSLTSNQYDSKLVINLPDDNATAMKAMICFCYTGEYSRYLRKSMSKPNSIRAAACSINLIIHIDVHSTAEKYNATSLQAYSLEAFNNAAQVLLRLRPSNILPIIKKAYSLRLQSNSLRSAAVKLLHQYLYSLTNSWVPMTQVSRMKNVPGEATELLIQIAKDVETLMVELKHKWECSICKTTFEYTGEAKSGGLKGKMCPWCKVGEI
jgi:hypothetical protein